MSDFIDIRMLGDKELEQKLKKLDFNLQKKIVRNAVSRSMLPVRDRAKELCPEDTGALKSSIKRKNKTSKGITKSRIVTGTRAELGIPAKTKGYYPAAIEYGYKNKSGKHIAPRSFMRKALTDLKQIVLGDVSKHIKQGIKRHSK